MQYTTDPNHPEFRKALRKIGAPDWYPENAPVHIFEFDDHYPEYVDVRCPLCSWKKRKHLGPDGSIEHVDPGEPWVIHKPPEGGFSNVPGATLKVDALKVVNETDELRDAFGELGDSQS